MNKVPEDLKMKQWKTINEMKKKACKSKKKKVKK